MEVVILKSFCSSRLVNFISGLLSKFTLIAISIASENGIFVNKLVTSNKIKNLSAALTDLIPSINVKCLLWSIQMVCEVKEGNLSTEQECSYNYRLKSQ